MVFIVFKENGKHLKAIEPDHVCRNAEGKLAVSSGHHIHWRNHLSQLSHLSTILPDHLPLHAVLEVMGPTVDIAGPCITCPLVIVSEKRGSSE